MIREQLSISFSNKMFIFVLLLMAMGMIVASAVYPIIAIVGIGLIIGGTVATLISARWPETFLILALWTNFMKSSYIPGLTFGEFGITPYMLFASLAALGFGYQIIAGKRRLIFPAGFWPLLIFIGFTTLSLFIVQNFRLAVGNYVRTMLDWTVMFLLVQMLTSQHKVNKLIRALLLQALFVVGWGLVAGIRMEVLGVHQRTLFFWQQFQKNDFAAYLGMVLVLALATFSLSKLGVRKLVATILLVAVPIGWMFTFSRGGFLAIITCLIIFLALERNKKLLQRSFLAAMMIGLFGFAVIVFTPANVRDLAVDGLQSIVTGASEAERHTDTITFRLELAQAAVELIATHPILGVGYNQWQFYSPITTYVFEPQTGEYRETGYSIHNRYLLISANNGLLALVGYLGFLIAILTYSLQQRRFATTWVRTYLHVFIATVFGLQVAMLFAPSVLWEWPVFGILLGLIHVSRTSAQAKIL